jgi:hypothetical protein
MERQEALRENNSVSLIRYSLNSGAEEHPDLNPAAWTSCRSASSDTDSAIPPAPYVTQYATRGTCQAHSETWPVLQQITSVIRSSSACVGSGSACR